MITAKLVSRWVEVGGSAFPRRYPKVSDDYTLAKCGVCGPHDPGEFVTAKITCTEEVWVALSADPEYRDGIVGSWNDSKAARRFLRGKR